ncbi:MAG: HIG1 domain-containing protein [Rickettsiales bacterium]
MGELGAVVMIGLMLATVVALVVGIGLMARGGDANRKYGNKMMVARVAFQGLALGMLALLLMMKK